MIVMDSPYISLEEVAKELEVSVSTVKRWLRSGELPGYKFGKNWRIRREDFTRFLRDRYNQSQNKPAE